MSYTEDERIRAKRRALYILAQRDHSAKELYDKLAKNYPEELCRLVVDMMKEFGLMEKTTFTSFQFDYIKKIKECMERTILHIGT